MKQRIALFSILFLLAWEVCTVRDTYPKNLNEEEQLVIVGIGAFRDGFYDIAEKQFGDFLRDYSNHARIYDVCYLFGKTLLIKGKLREAKEAFSKIINENKNFEHMDYVLFWTADIEIRSGNGQQAGKILLSIIRRFPKFEWNNYCYYLLAHLDLASGRISESQSFFKKASLLSNNDALVRSSAFWLGILSVKGNDYETALSYFSSVCEAPQSVPLGYLSYALYWLGEAQLRLGRFDDAKSTYKSFCERFRNDPLVSEAYWRLGYSEYQSGNIRGSIEIFQSFSNLFKDSKLSPYAHYLLGGIFLSAGDYSSSIKELNLFLSRVSRGSLSGALFVSLYWDHICQGEVEEAEKIFQKSQKIDHFEDEKTFIQWLNAELVFSEGKIPDSLPYFFDLVNTRFRERALLSIGRAYFFDKKFREAITNLDILLLEFPNSKYFDECLFIKGESLVALGNLGPALEAYELIVKQNKGNFWHLFALTQAANIYSFRNENGKSENAFKTIVDSFPNHPLFYHAVIQLGNLCFRKGNIIEAAHHYSTIMRGNFRLLFGEAYFGLGEILYQQGKYEKALASFEAAMQYLNGGSLCFFLTRLEIGNLQRRQGKYEEAKRSYRIILNQSKDEEIKKVAKELLNRVESY